MTKQQAIIDNTVDLVVTVRAMLADHGYVQIKGSDRWIRFCNDSRSPMMGLALVFDLQELFGSDVLLQKNEEGKWTPCE